MASGMPSSRRQISATSGVFAADSSNRRSAAAARSANSAMAAYCPASAAFSPCSRDREHRQAIHDFSRNAERGLARHQRAHPLRLQHECGQRRGDRIAQALGRIQNQQQRHILHRLTQRREPIDSVRQRDPERESDGRGDVVHVLELPQRNPRNRRAGFLGLAREDLLGEPGLSDSGNADDGHQACSIERLLNRAHIVVATDQSAEPVRPRVARHGKPRRFALRAGQPVQPVQGPARVTAGSILRVESRR